MGGGKLQQIFKQNLVGICNKYSQSGRALAGIYFNFFQKTVDIDKIFYYTTLVQFEIWSHGQEVKTSPFLGGNRGSIPLGTTKK